MLLLKLKFHTSNIDEYFSPGVCQRSSADFSETWDAGKANDHLLYNDGNPYLNYTDGAPCHRDKFVRNSIITFVCRPEGRSAPEFVMESDDCTYYFDWHTEKACEKQVRIMNIKMGQRSRF